MSTILIVDYGMANLRSVQKAFETVGTAAEISGDPERIARADKVVLPGVGAFRDAIACINNAHLAEPLREHVRRGKPFFGICLGMQLIFTRSFEEGVYDGLNILEGDVVRFANIPGLKVPHMGWNQLRVKRPAPHLAGLPDAASVYFVHSYYVVPRDPGVIAAEADYPTPFAAAVWQDNVFASQFHPEKSQKIGLSMLASFAAI
ncbi:MAG: imidazole glycerol phosphate synthase subunit HisH [Planctomycetota bacterium]